MYKTVHAVSSGAENYSLYSIRYAWRGSQHSAETTLTEICLDLIKEFSPVFHSLNSNYDKFVHTRAEMRAHINHWGNVLV